MIISEKDLGKGTDNKVTERMKGCQDFDVSVCKVESRLINLFIDKYIHYKSLWNPVIGIYGLDKSLSINSRVAFMAVNAVYLRLHLWVAIKKTLYKVHDKAKNNINFEIKRYRD